MQYGHALRASGDLQGAEAAYRAAIARAPEDADARLHLVTLLAQRATAAGERADWAGAAAALAQPVEVSPGQGYLWAHYGHVLKEGGDLPGAEAAYARAVAVEPQSPQAPVFQAWLMEARARAARARLDWPSVAAALAEAVRVAPGLVAFRVQLGHALKEAGDLPGAEAAFRAALEQAPEDAATRLHLAGLLLHRGAATEAARQLLGHLRAAPAAAMPPATARTMRLCLDALGVAAQAAIGARLDAAEPAELEATFTPLVQRGAMEAALAPVAARALVRTGQPEQAAALRGEVLWRDPTDAVARQALIAVKSGLSPCLSGASRVAAAVRPMTSAAAAQAMSLAQIAPWAGFACHSAEATALMTQIADALPAVFVLELKGRTVRILEKPNHYPVEETAGETPSKDGKMVRAHYYRKHIEEVLADGWLVGEMRLLLFTDDLGSNNTPLPLFSFQKPRGSRNLLLPDIDFLQEDFYTRPELVDAIPFAEKQERAVFVGTTTGGRHTVETVQALRAPRLRSAVHFRDSPRVDFFLPRIAQCVDNAAADAIRALGVAGRRLSWRRSYAYRYIISMDGNGATCSRVFLGLRSNSVLMKYDSPHLLYYFDHLVPWVHYIPIAQDADVLHAMDVCAVEPGLAEAIAMAGQDFCNAYLGRESVFSYTRRLLEDYHALCWRA